MGGVPAQVGTPPGEVHPLNRYTSPGQVHPLGRYTPQAGTYPQAGTPPEQVPPQACTAPQSMSGWYASYWNAFFLLPTNEVWGKVIFSEVCVKNSVHGESTWTGMPPRTRYPPGTRYTPPDQVHLPRTRYPPGDQIHSQGPGTPPGPSYSQEKKTMELERMVFWLTFIAFFTAGNQLRSKNGKKLWISMLEYRQHIR